MPMSIRMTPGNDTCIVVSAEKERASCKQNHSATDKVEIAYAYLFLHIFPTKDAVKAPAMPQSLVCR